MKNSEITAPDVYSVKVTLRPLQEAVISPAHGYQLNALLLKILRLSAPAVAEELHDSDSAKPFTVSLLQGRSAPGERGFRVSPESAYNWRLTFLKSEIFTHFLAGALKWESQPAEVGPATFLMEEINPALPRDYLTGFSSYGAILDHASARYQIEMEFLSPTAFRSSGKRNVIFPDPSLVFGSYFNRWQAFSPVKLDDALTLWLEKMLVARYRLETRILDFGSYQEVGFSGRCRFLLDKSTPQEVVIGINALADFAFYCGTGAKTTMGMGQTRRVKGARNVKVVEECQIPPKIVVK